MNGTCIDYASQRFSHLRRKKSPRAVAQVVGTLTLASERGDAEAAARYATAACGAVFCSRRTCVGEDTPLTVYTAMHKRERKAGNTPAAFFFPPVGACSLTPV